MAKTSDFGLDVKIRLLELGKTQVWLIEQVKERTGEYFDDSYLWKILSGTVKAKKKSAVIREILGLPQEEQAEEVERADQE